MLLEFYKWGIVLYYIFAIIMCIRFFVTYGTPKNKSKSKLSKTLYSWFKIILWSLIPLINIIIAFCFMSYCICTDSVFEETFKSTIKKFYE